MNFIGKIQTPFKEKFGIPRQGLLIEEAWGIISLPKNDFYIEAVRGLENFSHLWLIFQFHQVLDEPVNPLVRPPRFHGKKKLGVFATRSPHRPGHIGMSVVLLEKVEVSKNSVDVHVRGVDLLDATPIFDIKPYIPYSDSVPSARADLFSDAPILRPVSWACDPPSQDKILIEKVVGLDPRPGHDRSSGEEFGVSIAGRNVRFKAIDEGFVIFEVT